MSKQISSLTLNLWEQWTVQNKISEKKFIHIWNSYNFSIEQGKGSSSILDSISLVLLFLTIIYAYFEITHNKNIFFSALIIVFGCFLQWFFWKLIIFFNSLKPSRDIHFNFDQGKISQNGAEIDLSRYVCLELSEMFHTNGTSPSRIDCTIRQFNKVISFEGLSHYCEDKEQIKQFEYLLIQSVEEMGGKIVVEWKQGRTDY